MQAHDMNEAAHSSLEVRELIPEEYPILTQFPPFSQIGPPDPLKTRCLVVQDPRTGKVHGFLFLSACIHVEPYWVDPDVRKRPGVIRRLWRAARAILEQTAQPQAFAVINYDDIPRGVLSQARGLGFQRVPGDLYIVNAPDMPGWTEQTSVAQTVEGVKES